MLHKKIDLIFAKICLILSLLITLSIPVSAADITIEGYVTGGLTLVLNGDFQTGVNFDSIKYPFTETTTSWLGTNTVDFIDFVDDTETNGFYITISTSDFRYTGDSQTQSSLPANKMKIIGKLSNNNPAAVTKGYDDPIYNLSILPTSCGGATTDKFTFHSNLTSAGSNYTLTGSNSAQTLLTSTSSCLAIGHIRFDKATLTYPADSAIGTYSATMVLTMIDGAP